MTEPSYSWLYGTSPGWQCPSCGDLIRTDSADRIAVAMHSAYHCHGKPVSSALVRTR